MWKVFGLKVLEALVDGTANTGGWGTRHRRSGIASALDSTADLLFMEEQAKRIENVMRERVAHEQAMRKQKSAQNNTFEQPPKTENTAIPFHFYRRLLDLNEQFTQAELKEAYRICAVKYHPDQYVKVDPRERQHAEDIMKQINEAYEYLKEGR